MGFFGRKKTEETVPERDEEAILKEELEGEVEKLQSEFREKHKELDDLAQKIEEVKKEYDETISNIMSVKKEFNQKKMELDVVQREYKETVERNKKAESAKDSKSIEEFNKNKESHSKIKQDLDKLTKEHDELKKQIEEGQTALHSIRKQQIEVEKELDEANSRLYNAKEELEKRDHFEDTSILTPSEKEFIAGENEDKKSSAGIIEAASAVVGSLKSKLNMTLKELETVQSLLEKERKEHDEVKKELEKLKTYTKSINKS